MKILITKFTLPFTICIALVLFCTTTILARNAIKSTPLTALKSASVKTPSSLKSPMAANLLNINLLKNTTSGYGKADQVTLIVNPALASNGVGSNKLLNGADNIAFIEGSKVLANDGYKTVSPTDTISISISELTPGTAYQLQILSAKFKVSGIVPMIFDRITKSVTQFSTDTTLINFTPTVADTATYRSRYKIVFVSSLPVREVMTSAESQSNGQIKINWNSFTETNLVSYTIEKSVNGKEYNTLATVRAKNTTTASYSYTDANATKQASYYRIKALSADGTYIYSNVVFVASKSSFTSVYPNPLVGNTLHLATNNLIDGKYIVNVYSTLGTKVFTTTIDGKSNKYELNLGKLATGNYNLVIRSEGAIVYNTSLQVK